MIDFTSGPYNGQRIITHNLWDQGVIDEKYLPLLPDNATFDWEHIKEDYAFMDKNLNKKASNK